jgi:hypothetical protein
MDIDIFPNSVEYWGPNGMAFFRNVQARWMPIQGDTRCTIAVERPGASGDLGDYADRIELVGDVMPHFPAPDVSAEYRVGRPWGYVEAAGIVRWMEWDDLDTVDPDLSGDAVGWGLNLTSNIKTGERGTARLGVVYGEGIQNYMNDAPADVSVDVDSDGSIEGVALPMLGISAFMDMAWNERWSSAFGYSMLDIDNSNGQSASAFHRGHYALINLMHYPAPNVMLGPELQWGKRENNSDDFTSDDFRIQFSAKYNFSTTIGGGES